MIYQATIERKLTIEKRLYKHGIRAFEIKHLPYLEFDDETFCSPYECGCRMLILYAFSQVASELRQKEELKKWLIHENLWIHVSAEEKEFFETDLVEEQKIFQFSWGGESAYILAWALNIVLESPSPSTPIYQEQLNELISKLPSIGAPLNNFLSNLSFRNPLEIYDENIFYELCTSHFRDCFYSGIKDKTNIDQEIAYLRHFTLNWLRRFSGIEDWDHTDTST